MQKSSINQSALDLKSFFQFLSFPSVSSEPRYNGSTRECAEWLEKHLKNLGFQTELVETPLHPVLLASYIKDPQAETLLIYNHYDVQPCEPLELWDNPPFEPILKEGLIYARGAQDNKGQCFYVLEALKELLANDGTLPLNVKLCIEGEEECGSPNLPAVLVEKSAFFKADFLAIVDLGIFSLTRPALTLGTRGLITFELELEGSAGDLHSGSHGGLAYNPLHALVKILADLRNTQGKITLPEFYEGITPFSKEDLATIDFHFDEAQYLKDFKIEASGGEIDLPPLERLWLRPTLEINGLNGGYSGEGFKTVIPAKALAKISCRLVAGQSLEKITQTLKDYFVKQAPRGIKVHFRSLPGGGLAAASHPQSKCVQAFKQAYSEVFKLPCRYILEGASIPIIPKLVAATKAEPVFLGLGLPTDAIHAPNEHFSLERLEIGKAIIKKALYLLGAN